MQSKLGTAQYVPLRRIVAWVCVAGSGPGGDGRRRQRLSTRGDLFFELLHDRLIGIEGLVHELKVKIDDDREATKAAIEREIDDAKAALQRVRDDAGAARARMKAQLAERKAESADLIAEWKRHGEVDELERRAEDAEAYAAWSLIVATRAIDEVELATLKAIAARMDFENGSAE